MKVRNPAVSTQPNLSLIIPINGLPNAVPKFGNAAMAAA
jgi:hypothetical protein